MYSWILPLKLDQLCALRRSSHSLNFQGVMWNKHGSGVSMSFEKSELGKSVYYIDQCEKQKSELSQGLLD